MLLVNPGIEFLSHLNHKKQFHFSYFYLLTIRLDEYLICKWQFTLNALFCCFWDSRVNQNDCAVDISDVLNFRKQMLQIKGELMTGMIKISGG